MEFDAVKSLLNVALGREEADIYIENGRLLSVYSGEILDGFNVAVRGRKIAYIGPSRAMVGEKTRIIDAQNRYLVPGYIDAHGHADMMANPLALARAVLPLGTTAILSDTHEAAGALGSKGIDFMLAVTEGLPVKYFLSLTAANPPNPGIEGGDSMSEEDFRRYIAHPRVLAVSEVTAWHRIIGLDGTLLKKLGMAGGLGKRVEGHTPGCSLDKLNALVGAGITSCHESVTAEDVRMRVNLGLYTMLRHGSIRRELDDVSRYITSGPAWDTGRILLTPDWMSPQDIARHGYMDYVIGEAIRRGIPPVRVYRMATLNPAVYLGLDGWIGGIAPGRCADILFLDSLEDPRPARVMADGVIVGQRGRLLVDVPGNCPAVGPDQWRPGRNRRRRAAPGEFRVAASRPGPSRETVPVLHIINDTITVIREESIEVKDGFLEPRREGVLKISMISGTGQGFVTVFSTGFGPFSGSLATSTAHEHHFPYVLGREESDMALAFNRMMEIGGGHVLVNRGRIVAECRLAVGGVMSHRDIHELAGELAFLEDRLRRMGCTLERPLVTLGFISFSGIPFARITPQGLYDVKNGKIVFPRPATG